MKFYQVVLTLLISCLLLDSAMAQEPTTITLSWDAPTVREDGSALTAAEIGGYEVVSTCQTDRYIVPAAETQLVIAMTADYDCDLAVFTIDSDGIPSAPSESLRVRYNRPLAPVITGVKFN